MNCLEFALLVPAACSPGGTGLRKREALRGGLPNLCRTGTGSGPRIHKSKFICRDGQGLRGPYGFSCLLPFLTSQQVAPEEDICTKYILSYRKELLERTVHAWKSGCLATGQFAQKMSVVAWTQCLNRCLQIQSHPSSPEHKLNELCLYLTMLLCLCHILAPFAKAVTSFAIFCLGKGVVQRTSSLAATSSQ